jgi:curved DNA-binding protein CbpA
VTDLYQILGVDRSATAAEIKTAYRRLSLKHQPDRGGDGELFKQITEAFEVLSNTEHRERYDRTGKMPRADRATKRIHAAIAAVVFDAFMQDRVDPIRCMNQHFDSLRSTARIAKREGEQILKTLESRLAEFQQANEATANTDGRDFILGALEARIIEVRTGIDEASADVDHYTATMAFLNELKAAGGNDPFPRTRPWGSLPFSPTSVNTW